MRGQLPVGDKLAAIIILADRAQIKMRRTENAFHLLVNWRETQVFHDHINTVRDILASRTVLHPKE